MLSAAVQSPPRGRGRRAEPGQPSATARWARATQPGGDAQRRRSALGWEGGGERGGVCCRSPQTLVEVTSFAAINKFQPFNVAISSNVLLLLVRPPPWGGL